MARVVKQRSLDRFCEQTGNGLFGRIYFAYVDSKGQVRRPFVLPQNDPAYYDSCLTTFNVSEFATGPVHVPRQEFLRAIFATEALPTVFSAD